MPTYLEDFQTGAIARYGHYAVTREEVIAFATAYDPQGFHLDDAAAAANPIFGRVSASGWHTAAMAMRMTVDHQSAIGVTTLGSPGLDELRWLKPVYPGDTLRCEAEVLDVTPSRSRPDMGAVRMRTIVYNQHDEPVMRQVAALMVMRRPAAG